MTVFSKHNKIIGDRKSSVQATAGQRKKQILEEITMTKTEFTFTSSCKDAEIHAISWRPEGTPKAVIQLVHGMAEYIDRYDSMCTEYAEKGYAVYGCDHLGHGKSINDKYELGYFGENEKGHVFVDDQKLLNDIIKAENPGVPVVIYGHSMGSFVTRVYIGKYGDTVDAAVVCGTAGPNPLIGVAKGLTSILSKTSAHKGGKLMNVMAFMGWNDKTDKRTAFDWLSVDTDNVDTYLADPLCGFLFTNNGFRALITLNDYINAEEVYAGTPADLPIYLIAGEGDPVGSYGKGIQQVEEKYKATGHTDVTVKMWPNARHEIHNEGAIKADVYTDVQAWVDSKVSK